MRTSAIFIFFSAFCLTASPQTNAGDPLWQWSAFAKTAEARKMLSWIHSGMECEMKGMHCPDPDIAAPPYYGRFGIFITLVKNKTVRGCFGAFDHKSDSLNLILKEYTRGALKADPRYKPLDLDELDAVSVIVTIADRPFPVNDINEIDISRFGIMICKDDETVILVPAEMRSKDRLTRLINGADLFAFRAVCIK